MTSVPLSTFDTAYESDTAPWVIGAPQPVIVALERTGHIRGPVLDPGCGSGENALHLAELGYEVHGLDFSQNAIERARNNAADRGVNAHFEVADALDLETTDHSGRTQQYSGKAQRFNTVIDSALFHVFSPDDRKQYTRNLHGVCLPGATVHVLALADVEPDFEFGPAISDSAIHDAFDAGWELESLSTSRYRGMVDEQAGARFTLPAGQAADMVAWLARLRRV